MRTNTAVTLYSRGISNRAESWTRSVIPAAHWENRKGANVIASGLLEADAVTVWIPDVSVSIKADDVLVKGTVTKTVNASSYTMSDLKAEYPNAVTVRTVDTYDYGSPAMQHIRVGAS